MVRNVKKILELASSEQLPDTEELRNKAVSSEAGEKKTTPKQNPKTNKQPNHAPKNKPTLGSWFLICSVLAAWFMA